MNYFENNNRFVATHFFLTSATPKAKCEPLPFLDNGFLEPTHCGVKPQEDGSKCTFHCNTGYALEKGRRQSTVCKKGKWKHGSTLPSCETEFPKPFIMCPADITKPLSGRSSSSVYVMIPQPKTNVDWFR